MVIVCEDSIIRNFKNKKSKKGYYLDKQLKENLDYELKRVDRKWDAVILYDGEEGSAKTTTACANAYYMATKRKKKFGLDNIVFTPKQFEEAIENAEPYTNIVWDEFVTTGLSVEALTNRIQIELIKRLTMIRSKRLVIHLVIPYIFMLTKYFAIARTRCLIHIYSPNNLDRGSFMYYSKPNKRMLYMKGVKYWEYNVWKPDFIGPFTNTFGLFFNIQKYEEKKRIAMKRLGQDLRMEKTGVRLCLVFLSLIEKGWTITDVAQLASYRASSDIRKMLKRYDMEDKLDILLENRAFKGREGTNYAIDSSSKEIKATPTQNPPPQ